MQMVADHAQSGARKSVPHAARRSKLHWGRMLSCVALLVMLAGSAPRGQQPLPGSGRPHGLPDPSRMPDITDADQTSTSQQKMKQKALEAMNAARQKQLTADSARILALAVALKADMDKTSKDMLSLSVIRKADEIEKLAHNVKQKMKYSVNGP